MMSKRSLRAIYSRQTYDYIEAERLRKRCREHREKKKAEKAEIDRLAKIAIAATFGGNKP